MNERRSSTGSLLLAATLLVGAGGCDTRSGEGRGGVITPVIGWFVEFATATGEWVGERATTLATALERSWIAFWGRGPDDKNVIVDDDNPLKGTFDGVMKYRVEWGPGARKNHFQLERNRPRMVRSSETSDWELASEEDAQLRQIDNLREHGFQAS